MQALYRCLRAETLKAKNSYAFWLAWVGTSFVALALFVITLVDQGTLVDFADENPWRAYVQFFYDGTNTMLLPLFVIIMASLVTFVEHRQGMWKHLLVLNVSLWHLYLSKFLVIIGIFVVAHAYFVGLMLLSGMVTGILKPDSGLLNHFPDLSQVGVRAFKTIFSILGLLAIQYWISLRFKSFIVPLGVGVIGFVIATLLAAQHTWMRWMPYAHPLLYTQALEDPSALVSWGPVSEIELYSLLYCLIFIPLGYFFTRRSALGR